ncbi:MAG: type II toxin-antitoxin system YafQ family toxin [Peptococcaceae bacterium]|jgi:mRNA interferase YafQ|nr:type II toxin-antitoxin system YafQ family toxin [Peptococcaceae bacterium]
MSREVTWTTQFKKDYKLAMKRDMDISLLDECIRLLAKGQTLAPKYRDHALAGQWAGHRECHILPDWLLIYRIEDDELVLVLSRTGSHNDLNF